EVEIQFAPVSDNAFRLSVLPIREGQPSSIPGDGSLIRSSWGTPVAKLRGDVRPQTVACGAMVIQVAPDPLTFTIRNKAGDRVQQLKLDVSNASLSFLSGDSPLLGLGEGGPQFDRRGSIDRMRIGQGG